MPETLFIYYIQNLIYTVLKVTIDSLYNSSHNP